MNWGNKIFFLYIGFVSLIVTLVWKSTQTKFDLVSDDYYAQEVSFQQKLNAQQATAALAQQPTCISTGEAVIVTFPQAFAGKRITADALLYHAANAGLDKHLKGLQASGGQLIIPAGNAGRSTLQLSWTADGTSYYQEFSLNPAHS